jgi:hypothetical protein
LTTFRSPTARSSFSGSVESVRHRVEIVGEQVAVAVQRQHRRLVAQQLLHHSDVRPGVIANDAQVWRRSCSRTPSIPSTAATALVKV